MALFGRKSYRRDDGTTLCDISVGDVSQRLSLPSHLLDEAGVKDNFFCHFQADGDIALIPIPKVTVFQKRDEANKYFEELAHWAAKLQFTYGIASSF